MGMPPVRVDILMSIPGLSFEPAWDNRIEADFDGVSVPFISRGDLIASKQAVGRPQDLIDVSLLTQVEPFLQPKDKPSSAKKKRRA
jgi:hypothetical protein